MKYLIVSFNEFRSVYPISEVSLDESLLSSVASHLFCLFSPANEANIAYFSPEIEGYVNESPLAKRCWYALFPLENEEKKYSSCSRSNSTENVHSWKQTLLFLCIPSAFKHNETLKQAYLPMV